MHWRLRNVTAIRTQGHISYYYLSNIIIYPPTCVFSLLYSFGLCRLFLWPRCGQCCEYRVGSFTEACFMFTSFHAFAREGSGAICLIGLFCLQCCDRASVISSHIVHGIRFLHTFHSEDGKSKMGIWCRAVGKWEVSLPTAVVRCTVCPQIWLLLSLMVQWKF